jgi:hypothetical protein
VPNRMRWVGLDVHAHASTLVVFDDVTGEVITRRVIGQPVEVLDVLRELPWPLRAVYEAGPTGYRLVRRAHAEGIEMAVCSPGISNVARAIGPRTDELAFGVAVNGRVEGGEPDGRLRPAVTAPMRQRGRCRSREQR